MVYNDINAGKLENLLKEKLSPENLWTEATNVNKDLATNNWQI